MGIDSKGVLEIAMRKVKFKSKRQLDARHVADRAVLDYRARQAQQVVSGNQIHPPTTEELEQFAVGGGCGVGCPPSPSCTPPPPSCTPRPSPCMPTPSMCGPSSMNACYHEIASKYGCAMKVATGGQLNVDGQQRIGFVVEPKQSNFFLPIFVRLSARSRDDPDQLMLWRLTAVMVNSQPQENYHEPNPSAVTVVGVESVAYDGKTAGDVPGWEVAWGPYSRAAQASNLELVGWNPYPVGNVMHPHVEMWGYEISQLPNGWECGKHPGRLPVDASGNPVNSSNPPVG